MLTSSSHAPSLNRTRRNGGSRTGWPRPIPLLMDDETNRAEPLAAHECAWCAMPVLPAFAVEIPLPTWTKMRLFFHEVCLAAL
jgi:hypothetical protein